MKKIHISKNIGTTKKSTIVFDIRQITEQIALICSVVIFFHPDYTVGFGIAPNPDLNSCQVLRIATLADYTADREFHPAPKIYNILLSYLSYAFLTKNASLFFQHIT